VNLFLGLPTNVYKNGLLFNYCDDFIVLRNQGEEPHKPKYISGGEFNSDSALLTAANDEGHNC
jgi:hypothetical protein